LTKMKEQLAFMKIFSAVRKVSLHFTQRDKNHGISYILIMSVFFGELKFE